MLTGRSGPDGFLEQVFKEIFLFKLSLNDVKNKMKIKF